VRLNAPLLEGYSVRTAQISGAAAPRVVYLVETQMGSAGRLYSVPIAGGESMLLAEGDYISILQITPDATVLFNRDGAFWRVPLDGATPPEQLLDRPANELQLVGGDLFFLAIQPGLLDYELYRLPLDGSAHARRIDHAIQDGMVITDYSETGYKLTDDATYAIYTAAQVGEGARVYSVPVAGLASAAIAPSDPAIHGAVQSVLVAGDRALFVGGVADVASDLYSVPVTGGVPVLLSPNLRAQGHGIDDVAVTPDGSRVLFAALHTLFHVAVSGSTEADPLRSIGDVQTASSRRWFFSSADGLSVQYADATERLHTAWLNGSRDAALHYTPVAGTYGIIDLWPLPDRSGVLFTAETDAQRHTALFFAGAGQAKPLSDLTHSWMPLMAAGPGVAVYAAATDLAGAVDVYAVAIPRAIDPVLLTERVYLPLLR
jgi:hypothetical protein